MQIERSFGVEVAVIRVRGCFDVSWTAAFRAEIDAAMNSASAREVEVDLSGVEYMDGSALALLLILRARAQKCGKPVYLSGVVGCKAEEVLRFAKFDMERQWRFPASTAKSRNSWQLPISRNCSRWADAGHSGQCCRTQR